LNEMKTYLVEPKASELAGRIENIQSAIRQTEVSHSPTSLSRARSILERSLRVLRSEFYVDDVKEFIRPDEIKL
ncbi:MAG: hypothetical protein HQL11_01470, partial [Candidatus Omnitrophica bacterium]|nr:hypothetical protein [Candidatus Omnitrophota bacterium]